MPLSRLSVQRWILPSTLLAATVSLVACSGRDPSRHGYLLRIRCQGLDDRPVAGVALSSPIADEPAVTDSAGLAELAVEGREGEEVALRVERLPPDYNLAAGELDRRVVLKNVGKGASGSLEVRHDIRLRHTREAYVVLVAAEGIADLPVTANGVVQGRLNSRGAAAFRLVGRPGEELKVAILTDGQPRMNQENPDKVFTLPENGGILSFRSKLSLNAEPVVAEKKHARKRVKAPSSPTQIPFQQTVSVHKKH